MKNNQNNMCFITEEDIKENKEPEPVSPGCSQAISIKTTVADKPDIMLNKINKIFGTSSNVIQESRESRRRFKRQK